MKKYYFLVCLLFCSLLAFSSNVGHFSKNVSVENILVENVSNYFNNWFSLAPSTSFKVVGDKCDKMGIRHISFQQYYQGVEVEGCLIEGNGAIGNGFAGNRLSLRFGCR